MMQDKYPSRLLIFDTEAYREGFINGEERQTLRLGVLRSLIINDNLQVEKDDYLQFTTCENLYSYIEYFCRKDKTTYIYAHNIKYDLQLTGLLKQMLSDGWVITLFVMDDPPTFIKMKNGRKSVCFVDTFNYWQTSVANMGKQLKYPKLELPPNVCTNDEMFIYCKRDVDILTQYLLSFMRFTSENDLCGFGLTLASQSFRAYRHKFMPDNIVLHNDENATKLERNAYSGGRVEAWYIGQLFYKTYYKLDVNSMYPFVMKDKLYPVELVSYTEDISIEKLQLLLSSYYCIAEVELNTLENPYAYKAKYKLIFPIGKFTTTLHHTELLYALSENHITHINKVAIYKQGDIFSNFVSYFYAIKQQADKEDNQVLRFQAKIILNSLYGKFGQKEIVSRIIDNKGDYKITRLVGYSETLGKSVTTTYLGNKLEIKYSGGESTYSFPAIAGAVTAYARMYLYQMMKIAGFSNVFYCDTDSLIVNSAGLYNLSEYINNEQLGMLKVEDYTNQVIIRGCKDYTFGDDNKTKGIPKNAIPLQTNLYEYQQFRGANTWLNQGMPDDMQISLHTKERRNVYDKGIVSLSGNVTPLLLHGRKANGNI